MLGLWHFRNASGRIWMAILFGLGLMAVGNWVIEDLLLDDPARAIPRVSSPPEETERLADQVQHVVVASQIPKVRADGRRELLLGPAAAAGVFGGVILLVGGAGALLLWRRAAEEDS